jgi:replication-associated recombination protein RarA
VTRITEMLKESRSESDRSARSRSAANLHTKHLYLKDEVMSILQKAVRRGNAQDAMYWAAELDISGMGRGALDRLTVVASEDVSLTVPSLPTYINTLYK